MRIISGKYKGKKIFQPIDKETRPLRDLVKESIFNLIDHSKKIDLQLKNANILDLFSGSGSFGLECFSRNAKKVIFVESYKLALNVLKKNISLFDNTENFKIVEEDCFKFLNSANILEEKFDIIFIDPPYKEKKINQLLERIKENEFLKNKGVLMIHRHKNDNIDLTKKIKILDERKYGISKIIIAN